MTTKEELIDKRGLMVSTIMDDSRLRKVWAPEMADYTDEHGRTRNFWVEDSITRVIAMGHVTTVPQFRTRFNRWMENPPKRFSIPQMRLLEHAMGVPSHEFERLPMYDHYTVPKGMSGEDVGAANRKHSEAWSRFSRMTDEYIRNFGDDDMINEFDSKTSGVVMTPAAELDQCPDGATRIFFASMTAFLTEMRTNEVKWGEILDSNDLVHQIVPDGRFVCDIVPHAKEGSTESNPIARSNAA